jgi:sugar phosphate permease
MRNPAKATNVVLFLLCLMYLITYVDRVNISTAAAVIKTEFNLSNTQLGLIFSAFAYPYAVFQIIGGWVGDHFGPRRTLFACGVVWAGATILTGFSAGIVSLFLFRIMLGFGEGATFPTATRAMQFWTPAGRRGFAQGIAHSFARFGNAVTPPLVAWLMALYTWRGSFIILGCVSLIWVVAWLWYFRDDPKDHPAITEAELAMLPVRTPAAARPQVPWGSLVPRIMPVTFVYFCYGWTLWLFLSWIPLFFVNSYKLDIKQSAIFSLGVFLAGVIGDTLGGVISDWLFHRTGNVRFARLSVILLGFVGAFASLIPMLYVHDLNVIALCLSAGFLFSELIIGPIWSIPMDIAPKHSGTGSGIMNTGSAVAAIISPVVAGVLIDKTGSWESPFIVTMGLLGLGTGLSFTMRPDKPFEEAASDVARRSAAAE